MLKTFHDTQRIEYQAASLVTQVNKECVWWCSAGHRRQVCYCEVSATSSTPDHWHVEHLNTVASNSSSAASRTAIHSSCQHYGPLGGMMAWCRWAICKWLHHVVIRASRKFTEASWCWQIICQGSHLEGIQ